MSAMPATSAASAASSTDTVDGADARTVAPSPPIVRGVSAGRGRRRGFALIAALWLLVMLATIGLEFSLRARARRLQTLNAVETARARAASDAGIAHAHAWLDRRVRESATLAATADPDRMFDPWAGADVLFPDSVALDRGDRTFYQVTLRDAGARLNLNEATEEELRRLLRALRVDYGDADRIAQSIADWRDPDDAHRARGAEREWYEERGAPELPRNAPFRTVAELRHVRGITSEVYDLVRSHLTVLGTGRVNLNAAPPPVLLALPGIGPEAVAVLLRHRRQGRPLRNLDAVPLELSEGARRAFLEALPDLRGRTLLETRELIVTSDGRASDGRNGVRVRALFVRAADAVYLVRRRTE